MSPPLGKEEEDSCGCGGEEAEIYVCTIDEHGDSFYWWKINKHKKIPRNKLMKPYLPPGKGWGTSSVAALGSTIYSVGGTTKPKDALRHSRWDERNAHLHFLDTSSYKYSSGGSWIDGVSMNQPRSKPYLVPLPDGRLLVLGGSFHPPFVEIYDPKTLTWTPRNAIPPNHSFFLGHAVFGNKILFHSLGEGVLYSYDVNQDYWQVYSNEFGKYLGSSALVDGIMYIFSDCYTPDPFLFAYNFQNFNPNYDKNQTHLPLSSKMPVEMETTQWLPNRDPDRYICKVYLLAVGDGKLAMLWEDNFDKPVVKDGSNELQVHVSIFEMIQRRSLKDGSLQSLAARLVSHQRCLVQGVFVEDYIAVFNSRKVQAHEDKMKQLEKKKSKGKKKKKD